MPRQIPEKTIPIANINWGGVSHSIYSGLKYSVARLIGFDIHSTPGLLLVNQKMSKVSGSTISESCLEAVDCSNGIRYWFSSDSGKVWQDKAGTFTLVYTTVPESGEAKCLGAAEYNGYIYWFTQDRVHRIPINNSKADGSSNWTTYAEADWAALDKISEENDTAAATYTVPTSFTENAANSYTYQPAVSILKSIAVSIDTLGTGDWTLTLHDSANNVIATKTITNANMAATIIDSKYVFEFSSPVYLDTALEYHFHVKVSTGTSKVDTVTASDLSTVWNSQYTVSNDTYHPTKEVNLVLYIGDANFVHQIDSDTFSNRALDVPLHYTVTALGKQGTNLLVGTQIAATVNQCEIYNWNTYGSSFTNQDTLPEPGINAFLEFDNYVVINAGLSGNLYSYNGVSASFYKRIPGSYSPTAQAKINPNAVGYFKGSLPVFGVSNVTGNPCDEGVWSLGRYDNSYPIVFNLEFTTSNLDADDFGITSGIEIGAMIVSGTDVYISWKYDNGVDAATYGVDKLDYSNKIEHAILETRVIAADPQLETQYAEVCANYNLMPDNTSLTLKLKKNGESIFTEYSGEFIDDSDRNQYISKNAGITARYMQVRIEANSSGNNAPVLETSSQSGIVLNLI